MNQTLEQLKKQAVPILKKAGVTHSAVFGSVARGDEKSDSDVDMVIEFDGKKTLLDLIGLSQELEKAIGRRVDLVTRRALNSPLKEIIQKEEISIL